MRASILTIVIIALLGVKVFSQDSIPVTISVSFHWTEDVSDEWIHLKITDTLSYEIWYDSLATVTVSDGFNDTVYLDSGTYKCEVLDIGPNVSNPIITLDNGYVVPWGYPKYEFYLFTIPATDNNTNSFIYLSGCDSLISPSSKYTWTNSGIYMDTIPNSMGYDSIMTIDVTIISIDNTVTITPDGLISNEPNANYQWIICGTGGIINGATDQSYQPIIDGLYSVIIQKNGCTKMSDCYTYIVNGINIWQDSNSLLIYPNPIENLVNIKLDHLKNIFSVELMDLNGRILLRTNTVGKDKVQLDLSEFSSGLYIINIKSSNTNRLFKVWKQ